MKLTDQTGSEFTLSGVIRRAVDEVGQPFQISFHLWPLTDLRAGIIAELVDVEGVFHGYQPCMCLLAVLWCQ
ncbi:hypothetical protein AWN90_20755 [Nocardia terpenica]|uniref:Uncharacterized protein n=1 Tax=Nocardia terpenica TaxID=455432 RepID=A0A161WFN7_9NOCA|nr:hypothetical protein AWN90_20755 [Nocardia terpenica]